MADKSLSYFMRSTAKEPTIIEVPGVPSIVDDKGNVIGFKVKVLNQKEIQDIYAKYKKTELVYDKKGRPVVVNGQAVTTTETRSNDALRRIIVEALVYPDLKNKDLRDYYECFNIDDMPLKVFPDPKEYNHVQNVVLTALGILDSDEEESADEEIEDAKN